jgi:hypothetical protein
MLIWTALGLGPDALEDCFAQHQSWMLREMEGVVDGLHGSARIRLFHDQ